MSDKPTWGLDDMECNVALTDLQYRAQAGEDIRWDKVSETVARAQLKKVYERVKKVKNPYKTMTAEEAGKTPPEMCELETGFEDARQKILAELGKEVGE